MSGKIRISETENRCEESRMDSSPRFDGISKIYAIDFSCCMANEAKALSEIAEILGKSGRTPLLERDLRPYQRRSKPLSL
ncbi:MAG: hypothetical protein L6V93_18160 [Clostridiales bacterium]|nr:MAG: hypothetical protein L6V93_18160 [Clostridiales bacterium]